LSARVRRKPGDRVSARAGQTPAAHGYVSADAAGERTDAGFIGKGLHRREVNAPLTGTAGGVFSAPIGATGALPGVLSEPCRVGRLHRAAQRSIQPLSRRALPRGGDRRRRRRPHRAARAGDSVKIQAHRSDPAGPPVEDAFQGGTYKITSRNTSSRRVELETASSARLRRRRDQSRA